MGDRSVISMTGDDGASRHRAYVLTTWLHGTGFADRIGLAGYSFDYLARLYLPLLERLGEVHWVRHPKELEPTIEQLRAKGREPVHVTFAPFYATRFTPSAPNVLVLAWEFPDIPQEEFDGNPQHNWVTTADRCAMVLVASPFTQDALVRGGVRVPVRVTPSPVHDDYFHMAPWRPTQKTTLDYPAYVFQSTETSVLSAAGSTYHRPSMGRRLKSMVRSIGRGALKSILPQACYRAAAAAVTTGLNELHGSALGRCIPHWMPSPVQGVELSWVVYTSVFNPIDGRKNWEDLLTGFMLTLRDCPDATLVLKLASKAQEPLQKIIGRIRFLGVPHRCKVVVISEYLSDEQMRQLTEASTYYVTTTRAEGICLPLMDYLAAGRPGIAPRHTALADYFGPENGFVVESHPEPIFFPHDPRCRFLTSWQRIVWSSLAEQFRASYHTATRNLAGYATLSHQSREILRHWAGIEAVLPKLESALAEVASMDRSCARAA
jgi:glycosyltransferase involved in cell wall biosynthesis